MHGYFKQGNEKDFTDSVKEVLVKIGAFDEDFATLKAIITLEALLRTKILDTVSCNGINEKPINYKINSEPNFRTRYEN